jgi:hypothetical protein
MAPLSYALLNEVLQYPQPCEAPVCREVPNSTAQNSNIILPNLDLVNKKPTNEFFDIKNVKEAFAGAREFFSAGATNNVNELIVEQIFLMKMIILILILLFMLILFKGTPN